MYFETRAKVTSEGKRKALNYLVDAMSFTEAEAKTLRICEGLADITIEAIKVSKVSEVVQGDTEGAFYKLKASTDPEDGKPESFTFIIYGEDEAEAGKTLHELYQGFTIESITKTKIVEVVR